MVNIQEKENTGLKLSDTIFIFAITLFAYALTYNYDLGFKEFFNVPELFTEVGTEKLVISLSKIFAGFIPVLLVINVVPEFVPKSPIARGFFFMFLISVLPTLVVGFNKVSIIIISISVLYVLIFEILFPIISYPKIKGLKNKLQTAHVNNSNFKSIFNIMGQKYRIISFALLVYLIFIPLSKDMGKKDASQKVRYLVVNYFKNKYIVVDKYNDKYIVAPLEISTKTFSSKFKIIDLETDENKDIECEWLDIGPLELKK